MPKFAANTHGHSNDLVLAPININTLGVNQIIGPFTGPVRIYKLALLSALANSITFQDGGNNLSGPVALAANEGFCLDFDTKPWFRITPGNAFNINLSSAAALTGLLYYTSEGTATAEVAPPFSPQNAIFQPLIMP